MFEFFFKDSAIKAKKIYFPIGMDMDFKAYLWELGKFHTQLCGSKLLGSTIFFFEDRSRGPTLANISNL